MITIQGFENLTLEYFDLCYAFGKSRVIFQTNAI